MSGWLPEGFVAPGRVDVGEAHHLRPIRESDVELDYPAVMGSRDRLWSIYGSAWGWPPASMTLEADREDLRYHEEEAAAGSSFNYALFDHAETTLFGCCYIDPPEPDDEPGGASTSPLPAGTDAVISWWTVDELVGTDLANLLDATVPAWITQDWPFRQPYFGVV